MLKENAQITDASFPDGMEWPREMNGIKCINIISHSMNISGALFGKSSMNECSFVNFDFDGIRWKKLTIENTTFENGVFGDKLVGRIDNSILKGCGFRGLKLNGIILENVKIQDSVFGNLIAKKTIFRNCLLERVAFGGIMEGVNFTKCDFKNVDMIDVKFCDMTFLDNINLGIKLTDSKSAFFLQPEEFAYVKKYLEGKLSEKGKKTFGEIADILVTSRSPELVDEKLFGEMLASDRKAVIDTLYEMRYVPSRKQILAGE